MRRFFSIFLLAAGLSAGALQAAPYYYFEHYTTYEGLPSNTIHCTFQDRFGFVWIGTRDGLCRFDGYDFRSLSESEEGSPVDLASMDIDEDEDGILWFTTSSGIGFYNPFTGQVKSFGRLGDAICFHLKADRKGSVWFAGNKLHRYIKETDTFQDYAFAGGSPSQIAIDSYDAVWVILSDGSLHYYDKRHDRFEAANFSRHLTNLIAVEDGRLLVSTSDNEVLLVDAATLAAEHVFSAGKREIRHILERELGEFWIGTNDGLFV